MRAGSCSSPGSRITTLQLRPGRPRLARLCARRRPQFRAAALPPPVTKEPAAASENNNPNSNDFWAVLSNTTTYASQLLSHFRVLTQVGSILPVDSVEKVLLEASVKEKEILQTRVPPSITKFVKHAGLLEMKHLRKLCSLTALTYHMGKLTPRTLRKRHRLELVSTSWACERVVYEHDKSPTEVIAEGDGMAVCPQVLDKSTYQPAAPSLSGASNIVAVKQLNFTPTQSKRWTSPTDIVAAKLAEAAAATSAAAVAPLAAASSLYSGSVSFLSSQLGYAKVAQAKPEPVTAPVNNNNNNTVCPSEWFVCDDQHTHTRYFVIQGSDTVDHWRLNLTFDPVTFEDPELGIKVHRGVYEAALLLYERFLPLIHEHLDASPFARICFTGHSIGGSLATLLLLMYKRRGILTTSSISPVVTFGAPAVFCEGCGTQVDCNCASDLDADDGECNCGGAAGSQLLQRLGLRDSDVHNIIMHRDIVPRAFACDYSLVSDILKSWGPAFRDHACLGLEGRKHLYYFIGTMAVLQPDADHSFVAKEPYHPMLPPEPGLYNLVAPPPPPGGKPPAHPHHHTTAAMTEGDAQQCCPLPQAHHAEAGAPGAGAVKEVESNASPGTGALVVSPSGAAVREVRSVVEAVWELMDNPHPLDILADPGAYLDHGSISRYHNPDNYTRALGRLIHQRQGQAGRSSRPPVRQLTAPSPQPGVPHLV